MNTTRQSRPSFNFVKKNSLGESGSVQPFSTLADKDPDSFVSNFYNFQAQRICRMLKYRDSDPTQGPGLDTIGAILSRETQRNLDVRLMYEMFDVLPQVLAKLSTCRAPHNSPFHGFNIKSHMALSGALAANPLYLASLMQLSHQATTTLSPHFSGPAAKFHDIGKWSSNIKFHFSGTDGLNRTLNTLSSQHSLTQLELAYVLKMVRHWVNSQKQDYKVPPSPSINGSANRHKVLSVLWQVKHYLKTHPLPKEANISIQLTYEAHEVMSRFLLEQLLREHTQFKGHSLSPFELSAIEWHATPETKAISADLRDVTDSKEIRDYFGSSNCERHLLNYARRFPNRDERHMVASTSAADAMAKVPHALHPAGQFLFKQWMKEDRIPSAVDIFEMLNQDPPVRRLHPDFPTVSGHHHMSALAYDLGTTYSASFKNMIIWRNILEGIVTLDSKKASLYKSELAESQVEKRLSLPVIKDNKLLITPFNFDSVHGLFT